MGQQSNDVTKSTTHPNNEEYVPEGGWGWVVALGLATVLIVTLGPMACFGLIFGNFLEGLGEGASSVTLINSVYMCLHSFTGLLANYALKSYSCRQVALVGSVLFFVGNILTAFTTSVTYMIFSFAILPGIGLGLMIPASFHCFNAYFARRRVFVMGIAQTTLSGGMMLYPIIVEKLVRAYGFRGAQAIVAALSLHATLGALTFVPAPGRKRSNTTLPDGVELSTLRNGISISHEILRNAAETGGSRRPSSERKLGSRESISNTSRSSQGTGIRMLPDPSELVSMNPGDSEQARPLMVGQRSSYIHRSNQEHLNIPASRLRRKRASIISTGSLVAAGAGSLMMIDTKNVDGGKQDESRKWWSAVVEFFDLGLFKDSTYVNLALGVAFAYYSDFTFVTLFPLFMFSLNFSLADTALCIAIGSACDLGGRIAFSALGILYNIKSRTIFLIGCASMVVGRTAMVYTNDYLILNIANGIHGFFRAWIHANFSLVFAEHCPAERFPAAYGLFMAISGIIGISTGPLIGIIRDMTNSYSICIHSLNIQMLLCVIPWILEILYRSIITKKTKSGVEAPSI